MRTRTAHTGAALVLTAGLLAGCESAPQHTSYADNPLLQARQPLVQAPGSPGSDATQVAQSGPRMVVVPPPGLYQPMPTGLAGAPTPLPSYPVPKPTYPTPAPASSQAGQNVAAVPVSMPIPQQTNPPMVPPTPLPLPAAPAAAPPAAFPAIAPAAAIVPPTAASPPVTQAVVRTVEGKYGHAADYTWLQGELDWHYRGYMELRFRPLSEDDPYGGKVRLEDDPILGEFRAGDVIAVEGELLADPDGPAAAPCGRSTSGTTSAPFTWSTQIVPIASSGPFHLDPEVGPRLVCRLLAVTSRGERRRVQAP